jgi:hypothetical protein
MGQMVSSIALPTALPLCSANRALKGEVAVELKHEIRWDTTTCRSQRPSDYT